MVRYGSHVPGLQRGASSPVDGQAGTAQATAGIRKEAPSGPFRLQGRIGMALPVRAASSASRRRIISLWLEP